MKFAHNPRTMTVAVCAAGFCLLVLVPGCGQQVGGLLYFMGVGHGQKVPVEFELTDQRLAIFVDDPDEQVSVPEAGLELIDELGRILRANEVSQDVVDSRQVVRQIYSKPEHVRWSVRQIGEKLGAVQVIYIRVNRFSLHDRPGDPLYRGQWEVSVKVISTERRPDVRLWPQGPQGHSVKVDTPIRQEDDASFATDLAKEMARDLARRIALNFYEHTYEQRREVTGK